MSRPEERAITGNKCERDDLVAEVAAYVPVLDDGEADMDMPPMLDLSGDRPYTCTNCDRAFEDWQHATQHLGAES